MFGLFVLINLFLIMIFQNQDLRTGEEMSVSVEQKSNSNLFFKVPDTLCCVSMETEQICNATCSGLLPAEAGRPLPFSEPVCMAGVEL